MTIRIWPGGWTLKWSHPTVGAAAMTALLLLLIQTVSHAVADTAVDAEPNVEIAKKCWTLPRNVWTPVGWKDHPFRYNVVYNGTILCEPAIPEERPNAKAYKGNDFQLIFFSSDNGVAPPLPETVFEKMRSMHGPLDLRFNLSDDEKTLVLSFKSSWRAKPSEVFLYAPPVKGLEKITVNGVEHPLAERIGL